MFVLDRPGISINCGPALILRVSTVIIMNSVSLVFAPGIIGEWISAVTNSSTYTYEVAPVYSLYVAPTRYNFFINEKQDGNRVD